MDDVDRLLRKKALEITGRGRVSKCCQLSYAPGYVVNNEAQLRNAIMGCKVSFVMFFGKTCPYCHMFDPIFKQVGERYREIANFVKADIDQFYQIAVALGIMGTPATVAFVDGQPVEVAPGFMIAPQFTAFVESVLSYARCK